MAYERKTWSNTGTSGAIPISAYNLNRMEEGIDEAINRIAFGEFMVDGETTVHLGYKPRYLTVASNSGNDSFSLLQNTTHGFGKLISDGFVVFGTEYLTNENLSEYFDIQNNSDYFVYDSETNRYVSNNNNQNLHNTEAKTTLTAKHDMDIEFTYGYSCEDSDRFYIEIKDGAKTIQTINNVGGDATEKTYKGIIKAGQSIVFRYKKDSSVDKYSDQCYFKDIKKISTESGMWSYMAIR